MSLLAIILKAESTPDSRTIAYETYRKQTVITVQDYGLDEWVTVNHMAVPIVIFDFIQSFRFEKGLMKWAQYLLDFVTSYVREFVFDPDQLDDGVRKFFYDYDVKEILMYENQEGDWRDLKLVESIWKMNQILWAQKFLASHQHLPWFIIQLPVHLKTNQMMFWAVEALRIDPWASVLHQRNEESISIMKTNQTYSFVDIVCCVWHSFVKLIL